MSGPDPEAWKEPSICLRLLIKGTEIQPQFTALGFITLKRNTSQLNLLYLLHLCKQSSGPQVLGKHGN